MPILTKIGHHAAHDPDLVLDLRFDALAQTGIAYIPDLARNNHAIMADGEFVAGLAGIGRAARFDGGATASMAAINPASWPGMTMVVGYRAGAFTVGNNDPLLSLDSKVGANYIPVHMVSVSSNRYPEFIVNTTQTEYDTDMEDAIDHVLVARFNKATTEMFVDCAIEATTGAIVGDLQAVSGASYLAACYTGGPFMGVQYAADVSIWLIRIYKRVLKTFEIKRMYECGCLPAEAARIRRQRKRRAG